MTQVEDSGETKVKIEVPVSDEAGPVRRTMAESAPTTLSGRMAEGLQYVRGRGALEIGIIFVLVNLGCIIWYFVDKEGFPFLSEANLSVMSQSIPILALLAIGAGVLMIAGEFDLSIGANYTMSGLVFLTWYGDGRPAVLAIAVAVLVGIAIALLNGVITTRFGIPSFIVTLGAMLFWEGGALWYNGTSSAIINRSSTLESVFAGTIFNIRTQTFWLLGIGAFFWFLMHRHWLGNHIFAVGGNEAAARAISINPKRIKIIAFGILGALVGFAAVLAAIRVESMTPGTGRGLELEAIAAAVVGGTALRGGKGSILGMVLGAGLIFTVQDILLLSGAPGFYREAFIGLIIVAAAIVNRMFEGRAA